MPPKKVPKKFSKTTRIKLAQKLKKEAERGTKLEEKPVLFNRHPLIPHPISNGSSGGKKPPSTPMQDAGVIPKVNENIVLLGETKSGKTTNLIWMLSKEYAMPKNLFKEIYLISSTAKSDKSFDVLNLDKDNTITTDLQEKLEEIFEKQKNAVENDIREPIMIILEDITSSYKLIRSPVMTKLFTAGRHYWITIVACAHKFTALSRVARLNCMNLMVYPCSNTELDQIVEDYLPPAMHKKDFIDLVKYAWTPSPEFVKPFLYINNTEPHATRFRRGFLEVLKLT
jgi:hypothetical protein